MRRFTPVIPPFQNLIDLYWRDVARLCHALAGANEAEDVVQTTWLKALDAYPALSNASNLRGWLLTIATRTALDGHRSRKRRPSPVAHLDETTSTSHAVVSDPVLWQQVRALPPQQRAAIALRYVVDLPHSEIARLLDTTPTMSRRLVSDGLTALRGTYGGKK